MIHGRYTTPSLQCTDPSGKRDRITLNSQVFRTKSYGLSLEIRLADGQYP